MRLRWPTVGTIAKIKIDDSFHTYVRVLLDPFMAVYDCRTSEDMPLNEIIKKPILFFVGGHATAITKKEWPTVGVIPIAQGEIELPDRFTQDPLGRCEILEYSFGKPFKAREAKPEECIGLERAAIWQPEQVELRIRDYYANRPNSTVERLKVKLHWEESTKRWPSVGTIAKIKINDSYHTYLRVLLCPIIAVYDCRTSEDMPLNEIIKKPILFFVTGNETAITNKEWETVGVVPIPIAQSEIEIPDRFTQDPLGRCEILGRSFGKPFKKMAAKPEECIGLERAEIWQPEQIALRIRDYYANRPNSTFESRKVKLP